MLFSIFIVILLIILIVKSSIVVKNNTVHLNKGLSSPQLLMSILISSFSPHNDLPTSHSNIKLSFTLPVTISNNLPYLYVFRKEKPHIFLQKVEKIFITYRYKKATMTPMFYNYVFSISFVLNRLNFGKFKRKFTKSRSILIKNSYIYINNYKDQLINKLRK